MTMTENDKLRAVMRSHVADLRRCADILDKQGVMQSTRGPWEQWQSDAMNTTDAMEQLKVQGIEGAVATVGQVSVEPGGTNVIPGRVVLSVDARAPDAEREIEAH